MPFQQSYAPGTFGAMLGGRHNQILDGYIEARRQTEQGKVIMLGQEALSTSDFPTYLGSILRHSFDTRFEEQLGRWESYTAPIDVSDFETYTASKFGRFPDMPQKPLNAEYEHVALRELPGGSYKIIEWGMGFAVTRQLILSDRQDKLRDLPDLAAESSARTMSKRAVEILESNPTLWDTVALFDAAHGNTSTTALTADQAGATAIKVAIAALRDQTDEEGYLIVNRTAPLVLIVPTELEFIATDLLERDTLPLDVTSGTSLLRPNPVRGRFTVVVEPYLTDATNWYLAVDPTNPRTAFMRAILLNGERNPFIGLRDPGVRAVMGGDDPYSFDFDEVEHKVRHDFEFVALNFRSVFGAIVAG